MWAWDMLYNAGRREVAIAVGSNKNLKMAKALSIPSFLVILCYLSVAGAARTKLYSDKVRSGVPTLSQDANDGICESLVEPQGYACRDHRVTTKDGYILSLQRMSSSRSGKKAYKPPVLLQHGLFMDGATWLLNSADQSLAFILADDGYDVWIANTRGTKWSQGHKSLSPSDPAFWEWSWDELATYDLPAVVGYVHDQTGQKLHYVGHSLGTLIAFAAFSQEKVLNQLRSAALLSPIAYLNQITSPLTKAAAQMFLAESLYWLGLHEFVPGGLAAAQLLKNVCDSLALNCSNIMTLMTGQNCCINSSRTDLFLNHEPQSTATKNLIHLAQMVRSGNITMYDYGNEVDNMNHYSQPTPPAYNMASIPKDFPLFLGYGGQDMLADIKDVNVLLNKLKDHEGDKLVLQYREDYAHADFVFGVNANQVIYDPIMAFFRLN